MGAQAEEARALLEHARWTCDDLMGRIESFNQRAGVLLAASLALTAIGAPLAADRFRGLLSIVALALVVIPFCVPVVLASMVVNGN